MRLWSYQLLNGLPRQQLLSQLRECVAISKSIYENGTPNHILVNKIMDYDLQEFRDYCNMVIYEMVCNRGYNVSAKTINKLEKYINFNVDSTVVNNEIFIGWHNTHYINQCFSNLEEKYECGGVSYYEWNNFKQCCKNYIATRKGN